MASNFPSSLDSFTNPSSSDAMDSVSVPHATQHSDLNDAVEALQAKVGADSSAVTSSHDYKIADHASRLTTLEGAAGGKILQVVRATDTTNRSTTSGSFVDANISVTITPTDATSNILIIWSFTGVGSSAYGIFQITDASNVAISGFDRMDVGIGGTGSLYDSPTLFVWDSPASTSAQTYKGRFRTNASYTIVNANATGQLFAIEVGA